MLYYILALLIIGVDQLTKMMIMDSFHLYESKVVIQGLLNLVYVTNTGAAFSMFADVESPLKHYFFLVVGIVAIIGLSVANYLFRKESVWNRIAFACIAGGAAGNLIDRIRYGSVVDFIDVYIGNYHWPAFNVADSAICIGAAILIILAIFESKKQ